MNFESGSDLIKQLVREREARMFAEAETRSRDDFLALVAHELRTPLSTILNWTRLIAAGNLDGENFARAVAAIERGATAQERIIADIYDAASISCGKFSLRETIFPVETIVYEAIEAFHPAAKSKNISLDYECPDANLLMKGDAARLRQVFCNLLANALKFTPAAGFVSVCCQRAESGDEAEIKFSDSGCGIEPPALPRIFERFSQTDGATAGGLGLGLWIASQIVENHRGTIRAESDGKDCGATFTICLPLENKSH